jgi:acyl dehydratase
VFDGADDLRAAVGRHLGHSGWLTVDRARVDRFTGATGGTSASGDGASGDGLAPGFLVLSLVNSFLPEVVDVRGFAMGVNYGADGVRFPAPVPIGARLRGGVELAAVDDVRGGVQATWVVTVERDGSPEPACVVSSLARYLV